MIKTGFEYRAKPISVIGSTGSIGVQALEVAAALGIKVSALAANKNAKLIEEQARRFLPEAVALYDEKQAAVLKSSLADLSIKVLSGEEGLCFCAAKAEADMVLCAVSGMRGLLPTLEAISAGRNIALANKETLVAAGALVTAAAARKGVTIMPVDSEHSAVFQALKASNRPAEETERIILTASGGPFYGKSREQLAKVKKEDALAHPNWSMGAKITIDSATMMNKGLEVIEAMWLFGLPLSKIDVVVHRESVVHSMVEFIDGSVIAQLGAPDMRLPIQYALTYPCRLASPAKRLDFKAYPKLSFFEPDDRAFPCLSYCRRAAEEGGSMPAAVNAAGETAVELFLNDKINFLDIDYIVGHVLENHKKIQNPGLSDILKTDAKVRGEIKEKYGG